MKITDIIISALMKKGILYEARNCEIDVDIPMNTISQPLMTTRIDKSGYATAVPDITMLPESTIKVKLKIEHMTVRIEKE